jgi:hypothetical protein
MGFFFICVDLGFYVFVSPFMLCIISLLKKPDRLCLFKIEENKAGDFFDIGSSEHVERLVRKIKINIAKSK